MKEGLILSLVAVIVVFTALTLLYLAYLAIGKLLGGNGLKEMCCLKSLKIQNGRKKHTSKVMTEEEAAAVAMALNMEMSSQEYVSGEEAAAVAMALDNWFESSVHDIESYVITIRRRTHCN